MEAKGLFFSLSNPILFSILFCLALLGVIYIFYVHIIIPQEKKHLQDKENLELKNARLMALFAELDPDPLFRFNSLGKIILFNNAGSKLFININMNDVSVPEFFPSLNKFDFESCIIEGKSEHFTTQISKDFYDVIVKGTPEMGFGQIYCNNITRRKEIEDELTTFQKRLRELSNRMQKLQEEEKQKISRELHDGIGQILTSIRLNLELLKEDGSTVESRLEKIKDISGLIENAMSEIKEISYRLKPRILDDFGLEPSLKALCNEISRKSNIKGTFQAYKLEGRFAPEVETVLYRISQEALNNIVKHSEAKEFSLQLIKHAHFLRLIIEDDGKGFNYDKVKQEQSKKSMGLINMTERAFSINGKCIIDSREGFGTEIIVEIPVEE